MKVVVIYLVYKQVLARKEIFIPKKDAPFLVCFLFPANLWLWYLAHSRKL